MLFESDSGPVDYCVTYWWSFLPSGGGGDKEISIEDKEGANDPEATDGEEEEKPAKKSQEKKPPSQQAKKESVVAAAKKVPSKL